MRRAPLIALLLPLLVACGNEPAPPTPLVIVVTATPAAVVFTAIPAVARPAPPTANAAGAAATVAQVTVAAENARRALLAAAVQATQTAAAIPTVTLKPTATPGIGDTVTFPGWVLSLAKVSAEAVTGGATAYLLEVYVDARNTGAQPGVLGTRFRWTLEDGGGQPIAPASEDHWGEVARTQGRDLLSKAVKPGALAHPLVLFETDFTRAPAALVVRDTQGQGQTARFDLASWPTPTAVPPTQTPVPATAAPRPTAAPLLNLHGHASADSEAFTVMPGDYAIAWAAEDSEGYGCYFSATLNPADPPGAFGQTIADKVVGAGLRWNGGIDWLPKQPATVFVRVLSTCNWGVLVVAR